MVVADCFLNVTNIVEAGSKIARPYRVAGVGSGEAPGDLHAFLVGLNRADAVAFRFPRTADALQADRDIMRSASVAGVGSGETLSAFQAFFIGLERAGSLTPSVISPAAGVPPCSPSARIGCSRRSSRPASITLSSRSSAA